MPRPLTTWRSHLSNDLWALKQHLKDPSWTRPQAIASFLRPRQRVAWPVNDLGQAVLNVSARLHDACPSSFLEFYQDGYEQGRGQGRRDVVQSWVRRDTNMEVVGRLFLELGMSVSDTIGHLDLDSKATR